MKFVPHIRYLLSSIDSLKVASKFMGHVVNRESGLAHS
jgi:hypothetical protein